MMPDMDGIEFARKIKSDLNTSHIPFILLTAKTDIETKLNAMELCVDDYITKPFSITYLEARIDNLLKIRTRLQEYYKSSLTSGVINLSKPELTKPDEVFIRKIISYIEANYSNPEMNIDDMSKDVGVSRSSFFKKIKSLTGVAPVDFVREFRLQKAAQFIDAGETNISQISYNIGMLDTKYFSRCFRNQSGLNPKKYRESVLSKREKSNYLDHETIFFNNAIECLLVFLSHKRLRNINTGSFINKNKRMNGWTISFIFCFLSFFFSA
jgi:YesN/AraC family two-component response regulator